MNYSSYRSASPDDVDRGEFNLVVSPASGGWPVDLTKVLVDWCLKFQEAPEAGAVENIKFCAMKRKSFWKGSASCSLSHRVIKIFMHRRYRHPRAFMQQWEAQLKYGKYTMAYLDCEVPKDRRLPEIWPVCENMKLVGRIEVLIFLLSHVIRHHMSLWSRGTHPTRRSDPENFVKMELECDLVAYKAVEAYRQQRQAIWRRMRVERRGVTALPSSRMKKMSLSDMYKAL